MSDNNYVSSRGRVIKSGPDDKQKQGLAKLRALKNGEINQMD